MAKRTVEAPIYEEKEKVEKRLSLRQSVDTGVSRDRSELLTPIPSPLKLLYPRLVEVTVPDKFNADSCCYDAEIPPEQLKKCKKATSVTLGKECLCDDI